MDRHPDTWTADAIGGGTPMALGFGRNRQSQRAQVAAFFDRNDTRLGDGSRRPLRGDPSSVATPLDPPEFKEFLLDTSW